MSDDVEAFDDENETGNGPMRLRRRVSAIAKANSEDDQISPTMLERSLALLLQPDDAETI